MRMTALRFLTCFVLVGILAIPPTVFADGHRYYRGGGHMVVVPRYHSYYPYWGYGWGWGWGPYWGYSPYYVETMGRIKIKDSNKSDEVFINSSYTGTVEKMKSMSLSPGSYNIVVRRQGKDLFSQSVYVVVGKTVEIRIEGD